MDKKAIAAYWTLARLMHKIDPEKADTPQAKLLCAEFAKLKNMYLAYIDKLNYATIEDVCHADDAELMATTECIDVMLNVVQDFISNHSSSPETTKRAALAWKTLLSKVQAEDMT